MLGAATLVSLAGITAGAEVTGQGYYDGRAAFNRGDYATAYGKLLPYAKRGIAPVQSQIGLMHANGYGVPVNKQEAIKWYRKASLYGLGEAQMRLGHLYLNGAGSGRNLPAGIYWLERAANQKYGYAQYTLGILYMGGQGLAKDYVQAYAWLTRAVGRRYRGAAQLRDQLGARMSKEEIDRAVQLTGGSAISHYGVGVVVNNSGYVLTAYHLVDGCRSITTVGKGQGKVLTEKGFDADSNLALLKASGPVGNAFPVPWEKTMQGGQKVQQAGIVNASAGDGQLKFAYGRVTALGGPNGDRRFLQISAPFDGASSGGPVLDSSGRLVGIGLDQEQALAITVGPGKVTGASPYAIGAPVLSEFLKHYKVPHARVRTRPKKLSEADLQKKAKAGSVIFACRR